jgi:hypothetical protein
MIRNFTLQRTLQLAACVASAFLAGCGGGDDSVVNTPPELLQITTSNQVAVARATAMNFAGLDSALDIPIAPSRLAAVDSARAAKLAISQALTTASKARPMAIVSMTESCPSGGSMTISIDDRDNSATATAGDGLAAVFNDCRMSSTSSINGSFSGTLATYSATGMSGLFSFSQLTATESGATVSTNGQANLAFGTSSDASGTTTQTEMSVASGLTSSLMLPTYTETFTYEPAFTAHWDDVMPTAGPGYSTSVLGGKFLAASLGRKLVIATDPPVRQLWTDDAPQSGAVLVTGNQSTLRVTALSTTTARLELDANNDGTFDSTLDVPWSELMPY